MTDQETTQPKAPAPSSNRPLIVVILVVLAAAGVWYFMSTGQYKMIEAEGSVTYIDYASREAEMELPDPKGGTAMSVDGVVPADCTITVDGKAATLNEIAVGDRVFVKAKLEKIKTSTGKKEKRLTPVSVNVIRSGS